MNHLTRLLITVAVGIVVAIAAIPLNSDGNKDGIATHPGENMHCLMEVELMAEINYGLFEAEGFSSLGLWLYGHTELFTSLEDALNYMRTSPFEFLEDLQEVSYSAEDKPVTTASAIKKLNELVDKENRVNCLIFFSAQEKIEELPHLEPDRSKSGINRIVAVGLSDTNLHRVVVPPQGVAVRVPYSFTSKNVEEVVAAVMGRTESSSAKPLPMEPTKIPARKTSVVNPRPAKRGTTESPISKGLRCLFVYDLYNFGNDEEAYDKENQFVADIGERFFTTTANSAAGLWAYGHTSIDKTPDDALNEMQKKYGRFMVEMAEVEYDDTNENPLSTKRENTAGLPVLNPQHMNLERIVAVGLNNADMSKIIPKRGRAVSVGNDYGEEEVKKVVDAIMGG
ncbi:hypothetical protein NECAME_16381 [Necator americanus]|uniref:VWFA domain-containing protein n=1 Tax=Necator americanus TaxID=51031 RepID=W2TZA3_NECAM|nr:hypothetical protein NECAME_16381 [Necator americanus]ETN86352.1 hypothetical protein NECAME_16381 [Necator americanus]